MAAFRAGHRIHVARMGPFRAARARNVPEDHRGGISKFSGFKVNETGFKCFFLNGPDDRNPSSFCEGNRDRIVLQGQHAFDSDGTTLGATPNQIFDWIVSHHRDAGDPGSEDWIMRRYKATVHDRELLGRFLDETMIEMVAPRTTSAAAGWLQVTRHA